MDFCWSNTPQSGVQISRTHASQEKKPPSRIRHALRQAANLLAFRTLRKDDGGVLAVTRIAPIHRGSERLPAGACEERRDD
jgi:hypothetical protein